MQKDGIRRALCAEMPLSKFDCACALTVTTSVLASVEALIVTSVSVLVAILMSAQATVFLAASFSPDPMGRSPRSEGLSRTTKKVKGSVHARMIAAKMK